MIGGMKEKLHGRFGNMFNIYNGKKVLVTGHTGFKGSWLCEWLLDLGAEVTGVALEPNTNPSLFEQLNLSKRIFNHNICDIRNYAELAEIVDKTQPDFVFHLAAQPLVRLSYDIPVETYETNVMGTVNLLNILRNIQKKCAAVFITTDKSYENKEWLHSYRENDPMGGHDPYSSSKGCAELAISSFRNSYFSIEDEMNIAIASARAGNVIGGGDWALDRIVPDIIRKLSNKEVLEVRSPQATRPWQHVLEPLSGYLKLGEGLYNSLNENNLKNLNKLCSGFNFGPNLNSNCSVKRLVEESMKYLPGSWKDCSDPNALHEANLLNLAIDKAYHLLNWQPRWNFEQTIDKTVNWYKKSFDNNSFDNILEITQNDIKSYQNK